MSGKVVFKPYYPDQAIFSPYSLEELVSLGHPVRIVKQVVDQVDKQKGFFGFDTKKQVSLKMNNKKRLTIDL